MSKSKVVNQQKTIHNIHLPRNVNQCTLYFTALRCQAPTTWTKKIADNNRGLHKHCSWCLCSAPLPSLSRTAFSTKQKNHLCFISCTWYRGRRNVLAAITDGTSCSLRFYRQRLIGVLFGSLPSQGALELCSPKMNDHIETAPFIVLVQTLHSRFHRQERALKLYFPEWRPFGSPLVAGLLSPSPSCCLASC